MATLDNGEHHTRSTNRKYTCPQEGAHKGRSRVKMMLYSRSFSSPCSPTHAQQSLVLRKHCFLSKHTLQYRRPQSITTQNKRSLKNCHWCQWLCAAQTHACCFVQEKYSGGPTPHALHRKHSTNARTSHTAKDSQAGCLQSQCMRIMLR